MLPSASSSRPLSGYLATLFAWDGWRIVGMTPTASRATNRNWWTFYWGVDLVQLGAKGQIQEAILVAGDSDFIPAVSAAQADGVLVRLYHGRNPHSDLWEKADERIEFDQDFIGSVAF